MKKQLNFNSLVRQFLKNLLKPIYFYIFSPIIKRLPNSLKKAIKEDIETAQTTQYTECRKPVKYLTFEQALTAPVAAIEKIRLAHEKKSSPAILENN